VGEDDKCVFDAIEFIEELRQADDKSAVSVGNDVIVIGAGNTAIDAAIQAKRLGASNVTLAYRRGEASMSATPWEVDLARRNHVKMIFWASPSHYDAVASKLHFKQTIVKQGQLTTTDKSFSLNADMLLSAIGQKLNENLFQALPDSETPAEGDRLKISGGKVVVCKNYQTSINGVFAGGDCITGDDLTVQAVQDGKKAAHAIDSYLSGME